MTPKPISKKKNVFFSIIFNKIPQVLRGLNVLNLARVYKKSRWLNKIEENLEFAQTIYLKSRWDTGFFGNGWQGQICFFQNFLEKLEQNIANTQGWLNINIDKIQTKQVMTYFFPVFGSKMFYLNYYNILNVVLYKFSHKIFLRSNVF